MDKTSPYYRQVALLVPLTVEPAQIRQGLDIIAACFDETTQA